MLYKIFHDRVTVNVNYMIALIEFAVKTCPNHFDKFSLNPFSTILSTFWVTIWILVFLQLTQHNFLHFCLYRFYISRTFFLNNAMIAVTKIFHNLHQFSVLLRPTVNKN